MKDSDTHNNPPEKSPTLRVVPLPCDTNAYGDIFGGWLMSQMDLAGASEATEYVEGRVATVGVDGMNFHEPVYVGDDVSFYTDIVKIGRTSISIHVEAWARARTKKIWRRVTEGTYIYVSIDEARQPREIERK